MAAIHVRVGRRNALSSVLVELNKLISDVQNRIATFSGHTHGGVATGSGSTGAGPSGITLTATVVFYDDRVPTLDLLASLVVQMQNLSADIASFDAAFNAHTHGGVTTGTGSTGTGPTVSATVSTLPSLSESRLGSRAVIRRMIEAFNAARADLAALNSALNAHTHGGVATGTGSTGAGPSVPARTADASYQLIS